MGKKLNYKKLTLTAPLILALVTPTAALADTSKSVVPAAFASTDATQGVSTPSPSGLSDLVDPNNTQVVELTPEQRAELKNMYVDLGDGSVEALSLQTMQNESAKKAQARSKAMDKLFSGIIATRDELAAKADAEKKAEEEARAKKVAEEQRQKAEAKAEAEKKQVKSEPATTTSSTTASPTNTATVTPQSQTQQSYTPSVAANTAATTISRTYTSNFDVRVDKTTKATTNVDTSKVDATRAGIIKTAQTGIGGAYIWGGKTFRAWDCSGFVSWVFAQHGIKLTAYTFSMVGELKPTSNPQPGDIVFQNGYNHVGIYLGNGQMISALNPSEGTIIHSVSVMPVDGYYTAL